MRKLNFHTELELHVGLSHPKTMSRLTKPPCKVSIWKKTDKQTNWGYMWSRHSSKTRPSLVKPPCNASPETKDWRIVKPENWVSKLNIRTELGLCVGSSHPKTMSELTKPLCIKITNKIKIKTKSFSHIKGFIWCFVIDVTSFNFKDNDEQG